MDSTWNEDFDQNASQNAEWEKMSSNFTNAGYREGITTGKESALQEGFDAGFADVGAPLGQELGILRGLSSALLSFLTSTPVTEDRESALIETRDIVAQLSAIQLTDIAPRDLEAEEHARAHLEQDKENGQSDQRKQDMLAKLVEPRDERRPTAENVVKLRERLEVLQKQLGFGIA